jgi:S-adenosylmethionine synthetase
MNTASRQSPLLATHVAEWVAPGHPDRLADAIADGVVRHALALHARAEVGVEVAVHRRRVFVHGVVAAPGLRPVAEWLPGLVQIAYAVAGYGGAWQPAPTELDIIDDLVLEDLPASRHGARVVAEDQGVVVGWAGRDARTNHLPPAHYLAGMLGRALVDWRHTHSASDFGPDCKLMPHVDELADGSFRWRRLTLSIQHRPGMSYEQQHRRLLPVLQAALELHERAGLVGAATSFKPEVLHLNGAGSFEVGGPLADNGFSGKKLVVDHYGPDVPIGGGACYGKDPCKVDRIGPLRARQWAIALVEAGAREARTRLAWSPGEAAPGWIEGWVRDAAGAWSPVPASRVPEKSWFEIERIVADLGGEGGAGFDPPGAFAGPPSAIAPGLIQSYRDTEYHAMAPGRCTLRIDQACAELEDLHRREGVASSAFVTACNPRSTSLLADENAARQAELRSELVRRGLRFLDGHGQDLSNRWPPEASCLVLGVDLATACELGRRWEQNAIVWSGPDAVPRLILLR